MQGLLPGDDLGRDLLDLSNGGDTRKSAERDNPGRSELKTLPYRVVRLTGTDLMIADPGENIVSRRVVSSEGEACGVVEDWLVALEAGKVLFMSVQLGAELEPGPLTVLAPVEAVRRITEEHVYIGHTLDRLRHAPACDLTAELREWSDRL